MLENRVLRDSTGRGCLEACTWFPPDLVPFKFPLTDFAFSFGYNKSELYVWLSAEPCESSWRSTDPGVVLRELPHSTPATQFQSQIYHQRAPTFVEICFALEASPGGSVIKNLSAKAGNTCSIPGSGRSPEGGKGNPLQYSCLGNPMDRGAQWATVHSVTKNCT